MVVMEHIFRASEYRYFRRIHFVVLFFICWSRYVIFNDFDTIISLFVAVNNLYCNYAMNLVYLIRCV